MSAKCLFLEDFAEARPEPAGPMETPRVDLAALEAEVEAARLQAYESGYKTGWDDAVRAAAAERKSLGEELARNLRDLGFTYFEARGELLVGIRAFLGELLDTLFPELLSEAAASAVLEALSTLVEESCQGDVTVSVSPEDADAVRSLLPLPEGVEITVTEEPALAPGQARLNAASRSFSIDAEAVVTMLREALVPGRDEEERTANG